MLWKVLKIQHKMTIYKLRKYYLGKELRCKVSFLRPSPGHFSPPKAGGGSVQVRVRFCWPPPHVTGQSLQSFQSDQLPSTSNETHMKHYCGFCSNHFAFISHPVVEAVWACYSAKLCLSKKWQNRYLCASLQLNANTQNVVWNKKNKVAYS